MQYRQLGNTDLNVSEISFGTWAIGGAWGATNDTEALKGLERAMESGVNFFDTADVYGDGRSEELLARATKGREDEIHIASKFCRAGDINDPHTYSEESVRAYLENSLRRLGRERLDLYQIHCPPKHILEDGGVFHVLDKLQQEGKIRYYGVSVETIEEGLICLDQPNVRALQVIFNIFRQKPLEELLPKAKHQGVGILTRVPLASGLLTGKFTTGSTFAEDDHRNFNREGKAFNVGETFAGLPFEKGVELSRSLEWIAEGRGSMTRGALKWILEHDEVTCVIPGFKSMEQVEDNLQAEGSASYTEDEMHKLRRMYEEDVLPFIQGHY